jgi:hypothetical protein
VHRMQVPSSAPCPLGTVRGIRRGSPNSPGSWRQARLPQRPGCRRERVCCPSVPSRKMDLRPSRQCASTLLYQSFASSPQSVGTRQEPDHDQRAPGVRSRHPSDAATQTPPVNGHRNQNVVGEYPQRVPRIWAKSSFIAAQSLGGAPGSKWHPTCLWMRPGYGQCNLRRSITSRTRQMGTDSCQR